MKSVIIGSALTRYLAECAAQEKADEERRGHWQDEAALIMRRAGPKPALPRFKLKPSARGTHPVSPRQRGGR